MEDRVPPLIGAIIAYALVNAGIVGATAAAIIGTVVSVALSVAMQFALQANAPKPRYSQPTLQRDYGITREARGRTLLVRGSAEPHRIIYGRALVSGPLLFASTSGTDNVTLHLVVALAGHECESVEAVYFGDELSDNARIRDYCAYTAHLGDQTTVDADLAGVPDVAPTDIYQGITYLYCELTYDAEIWLGGLPNIRALVKGKKVWDPRTDTTAWSDNAALCQLDYLIGEQGINADVSAVNLASWIAAANICDESVALAAGGYQKRYRCNGAFQRDQRPIDVMEDLLSASAGTVIYSQGEYFGYAAAYDVPVHALTEDDLRGDITVVTKPARRELFNTVRGIFIDPTAYWQATDFPPVVGETYLAYDGETLSADVELPFTVDSAMAQRLAKIHLERHRHAITITFPAKLSALRIAPWDTLTLTSPTLGYTNKVMRVLSAAITNDLGVDLVLKEESEDIYAWAAEETTLFASEAALPNPWTVEELRGLWLRSGVGVNLTGYPRILCQWDQATDGTVLSNGYIEISYKLSTDTDYIVGLTVNGDATLGYLGPMVIGSSYDVRSRAVNALGVSSAYNYYKGHVVADGIIRASMQLWTKHGSTAAMTGAEV